MWNEARERIPARGLLAAALVVVAVLALFSSGPHHAARAAPGSPAVTPPLGWNSWNSFGCGVTESQVRQAADAMVSSGMRDAGYQYVVVDDCWFDPQRDAQGNLRAHPTKFPGGMKALGDYIHSRGLKFGIYQVPTERTSAQLVGTHPGSTGRGPGRAHVRVVGCRLPEVRLVLAGRHP
jgi:alpha-galactosidase